MAVLDNFYDFLRIYKDSSINILYNELVNGDNNIGVCEKNYEICKRAIDILDIKVDDFKEQYLLSSFLWEYANAKAIANENSPNVILTGAPGTGKTFLAKQIAKQMIGVESDEELEKSGQYAFVQFHPSYDYTDFVEGLRPTKPDANGNIGFELKDGIFKEFCKKAIEAKQDINSEKVFVFVIDEINRGEISKIFGELFFSIDPSYRGEKGAVKTQYSNMHNDKDEKFYVPENVYIIGTMNDIDRSVESFDFAIRRRFTWKEITAEQSAENMNLDEETKRKMTELNEGISQIKGLNNSYHIGGAYFLDSDGNPIQDYKYIWEHRIEPLLKEYLRGLPDPKKDLITLKEAYEKEG
ncbi:MAG: AAA domain-containing protein [Ignavibacteria bacterium]|jgi:5-methylcytosine-specific restriction protein B|nr:AAA domain-containing protein [Ignavibacteria bacterium]